MSDKPSYLGLLNAIAVAECRAHTTLTAWMEVTRDPDVRDVLATVAAREGEHGMSFAKRINELGYSVREKDDPGFEKRLAMARSERPDREKFEKLGLERLDTGDGPDLFDNVFRDHSIDIQTGELLGRYIAEERDSGRRLRGCYVRLKDRAEAGGRTQTGAATAERGIEQRLAALDAKVDAICTAVESMRQAITVPATAVNGRARAKRGATKQE